MSRSSAERSFCSACWPQQYAGSLSRVSRSGALRGPLRASDLRPMGLYMPHVDWPTSKVARSHLSADGASNVQQRLQDMVAVLEGQQEPPHTHSKHVFVAQA